MEVVNQVTPDMARAMEFFGGAEDGRSSWSTC